MRHMSDGPATARFYPLPFDGDCPLDALAGAGISAGMAAVLDQAPGGACVGWGIPFRVDRVLVVSGAPRQVSLPPTRSSWLVFMHTSDVPGHETPEAEVDFVRRGRGWLGDHAADYVFCYDDGTEERVAIRRRFQVGLVRYGWGDHCFNAVPHAKPRPTRPVTEQQEIVANSYAMALRQRRVSVTGNGTPWMNWLWAWHNPYPEKTLTGLRIEPGHGTLVISAISAGEATEEPLRWGMRRKALITLPEGDTFAPLLDEHGLLAQVRLDMGQVISADLHPVYPNADWARSAIHAVPVPDVRTLLVEYTAHPDACFHLPGGQVVPVADVASDPAAPVREVPPARQRVTLRTVLKGSRAPVAVKLHVHGQGGEYLPPLDRQRIPNPGFGEDYYAEYVHYPHFDDHLITDGAHFCSYIDGETAIDLPLGAVYIEVTKGCEIRPLRTVVEITPDTREVTVEIDKVLPWRERGWVTADPHVHFLSPATALLEGAGEGINVVNLLATRWGELVTNAGDFDGHTTLGSREAGGDGEHLVRVGTENRQYVLGHISLLGYRGNIIAPLTSGGPPESALGDPVEVLLTEWARQCHAQGGIAIIPHHPNPRGEPAAVIVSGEADGVEFCKAGQGIDPYSLLDWYRFLNCGYLTAAVGGTDKMGPTVALGSIRTYARIPSWQPFTYESWMEAVRQRRTFVTVGPLLDLVVDGVPLGGEIAMGAGGGTVDVVWEAASITMPLTRIELIVNGEVRESRPLAAEHATGHWSVALERSSWLALLVRAAAPDGQEVIAAHSSPVMVAVDGSACMAAADALSILEQIEGAMAYLDTIGTRAETATYQRMRLVLTGAHRSLHNRLHAQGCFHAHTPAEDHAAHY